MSGKNGKMKYSGQKLSSLNMVYFKKLQKDKESDNNLHSGKIYLLYGPVCLRLHPPIELPLGTKKCDPSPFLLWAREQVGSQKIGPFLHVLNFGIGGKPRF